MRSLKDHSLTIITFVIIVPKRLIAHAQTIVVSVVVMVLVWLYAHTLTTIEIVVTTVLGRPMDCILTIVVGIHCH